MSFFGFFTRNQTEALTMISMKLSEIQATLNEINTKLTEASEEIVGKLDDLEAFLDSDPEAALATLNEIRTKAQALADIV
jgi:hypothetical protein